MTKPTYLDAKNKIALRKMLFSHYSYNKIIGLAGPDINHYIKWCKLRGFKDIEIWEQNPNVLLKQLSEIKTPVSLKYGNILNAELKNDVLYDLDYCSTIKHMDEHIYKFRDNKFIMTFSLRYSEKQTMQTFFDVLGEKIVIKGRVNSPIHHFKISTENGKYIYAKYRDTSSMCIFSKL